MNDENGELSEADKSYLRSHGEPFKAVVYFQGISAYEAEIWQAKQIKINQPIVRYTYWILITDPNFIGRVIGDSLEYEYNKLNITFVDMGMRNMEDFKYVHFAGNVFRVRFTFDIEKGTVLSQDLTM